ncbi:MULTISPECIES: hypothetical protein [unclassified Microbacterium]|uniref:hypothetical protein n=1 Tax=unclassified Microbacterium TaxID=2609290 RepID=UPI00109C2781|nr:MULTISPECIES: hypothetical protein [unclassified Microbacterium]
MEDERGLSRRSVITAGAWSVPIIAVAAATPLAAASTGGGTLYVVGDAYGGDPGGIFLNGSNYNGFGATQTYEPGEVVLTFTLPEGVDFSVNAPGGWVVAVSGNVVTISNGVALPPSETGDLGSFSITGPFEVGSTYTVTSAPPQLNVIYEGNVGGGVFAGA